MRLRLGLAVLVLLSPASLCAATYYIRTDGGTPTQCTGLADAAYDGEGTGEACAWQYLMYATGLQPAGGFYPQRIIGGDTVILKNGQEHVIGHVPGVFDGNNCVAGSTSLCYMMSLPDGTPGDPTQIVGEDWNTGCATKAYLYGTYGTQRMIYANSADYIDIECLEITDHATCVESISHGNGECNETYATHDLFARHGIWIWESTGSTFNNLNIHGIANSCISAGKMTDFTFTNSTLRACGLVGFDGDITGGDTSYSGTITWTNITVEWMGCLETYPGEQPSLCWPNYGDGVGLAATAGDWTFTNVDVKHNCSDGLDTIYVIAPGTVTVEGGTFEGNAGNQMKLGGATMIVRNAHIAGNCDYFNTGGDGNAYIDAAEWTANDHCRAGGDALVFAMARLEDAGGHDASVANVTITANHYCVWYDESTGTCDNSETATTRNIICQGDNIDTSVMGTNCGDLGSDWDNDYWVVFNTKEPDPCVDIGVNCSEVDPKLSTVTFTGTNDFVLASGSPAIDAGVNVGTAVGDTTVPTDDHEGNTRPAAAVDLGAYEYGASSPPPQAQFSGAAVSGVTIQ